MISKTLASLFALFIFVSVSFGQQTDDVYYFNSDFGICPKEKSVFTGHGTLENNLFNLRVYSNKFPGKPLLVANFTDSTLSVNQGPFQSYYLNGIEESERNYNNNVLDGAWKNWDSTGHLTDSLMYVNGKITDSSKFYYSEKGALNNFYHIDFVNDKLERIYYNDSGKISSEVYFTGQKGIRKDYENGKVTIDSLFTREEKEASFPGGGIGWMNYISRKLTSNIDKFSTRDYGTCVVRFIIDTTGEVRDVEATTMKGTLLARVAVQAIKNGPKWIPAKQYGRRVNAYRLQPVTLSSF
jgi:antitoxin component YwqK of YwqJK toxin-antitoxin module